MIQKRLKDANAWDNNLTPYVKSRLLKVGDVCRKFTCFYVGNQEYEDNTQDFNWIVDLGKKACDYRE